MSQPLEINTLRDLSAPVNQPTPLVHESRPHTLRRVLVDLDAASNGVAAGIIISELLHIRPEHGLAASFSIFWLIIQPVAVMLANRNNFLNIQKPQK